MFRNREPLSLRAIVCSFSYTSRWKDTDLTNITGESAYRLVIGFCASGSGGKIPAINLFVNSQTDDHIHYLSLPSLNGAWTDADVTNLSSSPVDVVDGAVAFGTPSNGEIFLYTPGATSLPSVDQFYFNRQDWIYQQVPPSAYYPYSLTGFAVDRSQYVFYVAGS